VALNDAAQRTRIREAILQYLHRYPLAADTADGILACWLPRAGFEDAPVHIATVLEDMVADRCLQARPLPDGKTLFYPRTEDGFGGVPASRPVAPNRSQE
jgi:hypothetical protein